MLIKPVFKIQDIIYFCDKKNKKINSWKNRLIEGDSLVVMDLFKSKKYKLRGKFKMIYIDPPYGPKFSNIYSNYYPNQNNCLSINIHTINKLSDKSLSKKIKIVQPNYLKTEKKYYDYLYKLLKLSRELLRDDGSLFIQSPKNNLGKFLSILSVLFGNNLISIIPFNKRGLIIDNKPLVDDCDFILWFCKDKKKFKYNTVVIENKKIDNELYILIDLKCKKNIKGHKYDFKSIKFDAIFGNNTNWLINKKDMNYLFSNNRLVLYKNNLYCKIYNSDLNFNLLSDLWEDTIDPRNKNYPVQTSREVLKRCIMLGSNKNDLILDPTCGSGTMPLIASQLGRRWVACDISPEAINSTKQRLQLDQKNLKQRYNKKDATFINKTLENVIKIMINGKDFIILNNYLDYSNNPFIVEKLKYLKK